MCRMSEWKRNAIDICAFAFYKGYESGERATKRKINQKINQKNNQKK